MANQAGYYGFKPVKMLGAAYNGQSQNEYTIGNNEASAIYQGDPVILVANGAIDVGSTAGAELIGIFNGCEYTDPTTGKPTWSNHYPGSVAAADIKAYVIDDPNVIFDGSTFTTNAGANFRVVGLSTDVDNSDYTAANAAIQVKINLHSLTDTTGI